MSFHRFLFFVFSILFSYTPAQENIPDKFKAKVIAIEDGDSIEVLYNEKPLKIRLAHIDCPEKGQPFGKAAKQFISNMCFGQTVTVVNYDGFDRYKRWVAVIVNDKEQTVNKELVRAGLAWHYKRYSSDKEYDKLERIAQEKKAGLWVDKDPTPPWEWRRNR